MNKEPIYPEEKKEQRWKEMMEKVFPEQKYCEGCICYGNWRKIVAREKDRIGKDFINEEGEKYNFFGIVYENDDYYYGMYGNGNLQLLSCCGDIESWGYKECK